MAASTKIPTKLKLKQVTGTPIDFDSDTLKCMAVVAGSGAPDITKTGVEFVSDVTSSNAEVTGTGYSRQTLSGVTVAYDSGGTTVVDFSFSDITFAQNAAGPTNIRYFIFFKDAGGADSANKVFAVADPDGTLSMVTGDVVVKSPTGGLIQW